ncbi:SOS response-associated peptidase [Sphingobium boeckii]|uniref:Abasic site processing protein n=1 Tax=Sphingobium boeckii TaxID=1082345 RepID=A0A7W9AG56_9SPHN|nr:SOS response-associated peptidase family protein [Sphingobium boeckii]MBB5685005.1 putative SOS response-associated peptidase YedK [Sphingobium boeckii]
MCNLHANRKSAAEVARIFQAIIPHAFNAVEETYPGTPGMVVREVDGQRILQSMTWGFPLLTRAMKERGSKPKPANQAADLTLPTWRSVAPNPANRCLIPLTAFAEPEGEKGRMTRTWFRVKDQPLFAWAGIWRSSIEWGDVYAGVTCDANAAVMPVQDRMPILLMPDEQERWLHGTIDDVIAFQHRPFPDELIEIDRTAEPWTQVRRGSVQERLL